MNKGVDLLYVVSIVSLIRIAQGNFHFPIVTGLHTVNDGESLTLLCSFGDQTATLSWKKDDGVLPQGVIVSSPDNLTISSVDYVYHPGSYQCVATFPNGSSIVSQPFIVTVQYISGELTICEVTNNGEIVNEINNEQYLLIQNSNITIKCCRPPAVPNVMVTWNLNEQTPTGDSITYKEDNTILEINNILNTQHAGFYKCIGSHPTLSETIQFSEIYVRVRDEESTQPPPNEPINVYILSTLVCVELGGNVTIPCTVTGPDNTDVKWSIGNTPVALGDRYSVSDADNSLTIMNVRESDARSVKCQASLTDDEDETIDTASDTVELDTHCIKSALIQTSTPTIGIGTSLELICIISTSLSDVPEITWTSPSGSMTTGDTLKIQNISYSHAGEYTCTADHPNSEPKSDSIIIIVEGPPSISVILDPFEVLLNHTLSITCITNSTHNPSLVWSKGEDEVVSRDGVLVFAAGNSSTVNINRVREEDATSYSCQLNDSIHNPVSKTIQVNLSTSIYLSRPLPDRSGIANYNFSIACPITGGTRSLSVMWYKEATAVVSRADGIVIRTNTEGFSELYISSLNISHEGLYMCKATDNISEFNTSFFVTVNIPGKFVTDLPAKRKMNVSEGESVVFDCKVDGKPLPEVNWYDVKIGGRITADFNGSVITISDIRIEDKGNYVCYFHRIDGGTRLREVILDVKEANENTSENDNSEENDNDENYNMGLHQSVIISIALAGVGALFLLFTIMLCCGLLCYFKCYRDRQNNEIPKVINLETTSFERKPSIRGSYRNKDNSGILQQSPSNISSLWTFASDGQSNSIPITIASSVAVSPGPPLPSLGPTTSMVTEDEFRLPNGVTNFPRQNLKLDNVMGEGEFGPVFRGVARHICRDEEQSIVAVKVLMPREGEDHLWPSLIDFANQMKLSSPFIASILGICADTEPYYVIYDYLDRGDLKQFLMNSRPNQNLQPSLTQSELLHIATQVSQGMSYLYKQQIIHGDLATRNCLISSNLTVKIADLGIGHDLYSEDYYDNGTQLLPIRWMAPELFVDSEEGPAFSLASDVWSFGVFCWEVFAYARQPYDELSDPQVLRLIPAGHVLSAPEEGCPPLLFSLMQDCLAANMDQRPIFTEITPVILSIDVD